MSLTRMPSRGMARRSAATYAGVLGAEGRPPGAFARPWRSPRRQAARADSGGGERRSDALGRDARVGDDGSDGPELRSTPRDRHRPGSARRQGHREISVACAAELGAEDENASALRSMASTALPGATGCRGVAGDPPGRRLCPSGSRYRRAEPLGDGERSPGRASDVDRAAAGDDDRRASPGKAVGRRRHLLGGRAAGARADDRIGKGDLRVSSSTSRGNLDVDRARPACGHRRNAAPMAGATSPTAFACAAGGHLGDRRHHAELVPDIV